MKLYTYQEVAQHNTRSDLWMIINKYIYDITRFLNDHPEDEKVLLEQIKQGGNTAFESMSLSRKATKALSKYQVGRIDIKSKNADKKPQTLEEQAAGSLWRIPIALTILVVYVWFLFQIFYRQFT